MMQVIEFMNPDELHTPSEVSKQDITPMEKIKVWLKLGIMSFGGLAGQVALFYEVLVKRKKWLDEKTFFRAVNYCIMLPGATGHQLATYCGWLNGGIRGGIFTGLLYVFPAVILMFILSTIYVLTQHLDIVQSFFLGVKAAIIIIIADSLVSLAKNILKSPLWFILSMVIFLGLFLFQLGFATVIITAVIFGLGFAFIQKITETYHWPHKPIIKELKSTAPLIPAHSRPKIANTFKVLLIGLLVWWGPILLLGAFLGMKDLFVQEAVFVSKVAMIAFGGTYPVLGYVSHTVIDQYHWMTAHQMIDGLGLMVSIPGPVIVILQFIAFITAFEHAATTYPLLAGLAASVVCFFAVFTPCFLWVFLGAPYVEYLSDVSYLKTVFQSISATVFGVIVNLTLWFGMNVLFTKVDQYDFGYMHLSLPDFSTLHYSQLLLTIIAALLLFKFKLSILKIIAITALTGVLMNFIIH